MLVPISVYNSNIKNQPLSQRRTYPFIRANKPTYQIESVKKDINKNLSAKADSFVDKVLSLPRKKHSTSNFLVLDGRNTGVSQTDFAQTLKRNNVEVRGIYFTLLLLLTPSLVLNKNAKEKVRRSWVPFKI